MDITDAELAALYHRYAHVLFHRCRAILRSDEDANDAVQETFARVLRNADGFRAQASPLTWMYRISTNYCLNQLRDGGSRRRKLEDRGTELTPGAASEDELREDHARILALLDGQDEQTRQCVIYTYFDDCTRQETARLVGISVPTVRKRLDDFLASARRRFGLVAAAAAPIALTPWLWSP